MIPPHRRSGQAPSCRPGRGASNRIAGPAEEQLRRALEPRPVEPLPREAARRLAATIREYPDLLREALAELLADDIADIALAVAQETKR